MKTILVVDDERSMHDLYKDMFVSQGSRYQLLFATSVEEAVEILNSKIVDLIVLDIIMEPIPGQYLYLKITQDEVLKRKHIPIIIASVLKKEMLSRLQKMSDVTIFQKPLKQDDFLKKVEDLTYGNPAAR
jgi:CheY-like chemotaxis protein